MKTIHFYDIGTFDRCSRKETYSPHTTASKRDWIAAGRGARAYRARPARPATPAATPVPAPTSFATPPQSCMHYNFPFLFYNISYLALCTKRRYHQCAALRFSKIRTTRKTIASLFEVRWIKDSFNEVNQAEWSLEYYTLNHPMDTFSF